MTLGDGLHGPGRIQARAVVGHLDQDLAAGSP